MSRHAGLIPILILVLVVPVRAGDSLVMPPVTGLGLYDANKALCRMGLEVRFEQVAVDTAEVPEFHIAGQVPDSGAAVEEGAEALLRFNCPVMLRYWDDWVVPLLGDFRNTVGLYRATRPPEPIRTPGAGYPDELLACAFSGGATVEALIDFDGSVLAARVVESSGYEEADSAACQAALRALFSPAEHYEKPARVWFPIPYVWKFDDVTGLPEFSGEVNAPGSGP